MRTIFSIFIWIYWSLCFFLFCVLVTLLYVLTFPFDRYNQIPNKAIRWLGFIMMRINPCWRIYTSGLDPAKIENPTLVVANHQSFLDMPLTHVLPWSMKWVSKRSLFYIPILGWIIYMTGHIGIDRKSLKSVKKLDKLVEPIQDGIPGMIFPEGTRTEDGELQSFKNGAFVLAKQYNFNILPVVLEGSYEAMPIGSWRIKFKQDFHVSVLEPVQADRFDSLEMLKNHIFECMEGELQEIRKG